MADRATLASLGMIRWYTGEVNAGRQVVLLVILADTADGPEADSALIQHDTLADVLAVAANKEAAWQGGTPYTRKSYSAVSLARDGANARWQYDLATDPTWSTAADPNATYKLAKLGVCVASTADAANSSIVPLVWLDWPATADGSNLTFTFDASGFYLDSAT